jgi:hypothetical protein
MMERNTGEKATHRWFSLFHFKAKTIVLSVTTISIVVASFVFGIIVHKSQIFPYQVVKYLDKARSVSVTCILSGYTGEFSIGIFTGSSLFELNDPIEIENPVLSTKDVTDIDARLVADPFIIRDSLQFYMFFEVVNRETDKGEIAYALSPDGMNWTYKRVVLREPFHLSYPYTVKWEGEYYMIPETHQDLSVRLYKAVDFPTQWEFVGTLLRGYPFADPSLLRHDGKWWLFVSADQDRVLNLYYSDLLSGPWIQHPDSPIVRDNGHIARPGGRIQKIDGIPYRFAQDDLPSYGKQVFSFRINELSATSYEEEPVSSSPILRPGGDCWNAGGMHHMDAVQLEDGNWISSVDGF